MQEGEKAGVLGVNGTGNIIRSKGKVIFYLPQNPVFGEDDNKKQRKEAYKMELILKSGRPESMEGRLEKEIAVYDLLDSLNIGYERVDHEAAFTMEACEAIDKVLAPAVVCKNLFLCNAQKTKFYLLMISEGKKFKTKEISHQINSPRLSFAPLEFMEEYLDITPGSVSVMGLMNDKENKVALLIDEDVLSEEYFGCHPCINTSSLRMKTEDLVKLFLPAVHHEYTVVHLEGESQEAKNDEGEK